MILEAFSKHPAHRSSTLRITDAKSDTQMAVPITNYGKQFIGGGATDWQGNGSDEAPLSYLMGRHFIATTLANQPESTLSPEGIVEHLRRTQYVALLDPPNSRNQIHKAAFVIATPTREGVLHYLQSVLNARVNRPFTSITTAELDISELVEQWKQGKLPLVSTYTVCKEPERRLSASHTVSTPELAGISNTAFKKSDDLRYPVFEHSSFRSINPLSKIGQDVSAKLLAIASTFLIENRKIYIDRSLLRATGDSTAAVTERIVAFVDYLNVAFALRLESSHETYLQSRFPRQVIRFSSDPELLASPLYADVVFTAGNVRKNDGVVLNASSLQGDQPGNELYLMFKHVLFGNTPIEYLQRKVAQSSTA